MAVVSLSLVKIEEAFTRANNAIGQCNNENSLEDTEFQFYSFDLDFLHAL